MLILFMIVIMQLLEQHKSYYSNECACVYIFSAVKSPRFDSFVFLIVVMLLLF